MTDSTTRNVVVVTAGGTPTDPEVSALYVDGRKASVCDGKMPLEDLLAVIGQGAVSLDIDRKTCNDFFKGPCIGRFTVFENMAPPMYIDVEIDKPAAPAKDDDQKDSWAP